MAKKNGFHLSLYVRNQILCYDSEYKLYSFDFSDFKNSVIKLPSAIPIDLVGKWIRQRFTNIEENDFWWEQGIVIRQDLKSSSNFTVNFLDNDECDESDSSLNVYKVLVLPFKMIT